MTKYLLCFFACFLNFVCLFAQSPTLAALKEQLRTAKNAEAKVAIFYELAKVSLPTNAAESIKYLYEAIAQTEDTTITDKNIALYLLLQDALKKHADNEQLAENSLALADFYSKNKQMKEKSTHIRTAGNAYEQIGNYELALKAYRDWADSEQNMGNDLGYLEALNAMGIVLRTQRNFEKAKPYFLETIQKGEKGYKDKNKEGEKRKYALLLGDSYNAWGGWHYWQENIDSALFYFTKSYQFRLQAKDTVAYSKSMNNLGLIYRRKKDYKKALANFNACLQVLFAKQDSIAAITALNNIGKTYILMGNSQKADEILQQALSIAHRKKAKPKIEETYTTLVELYDSTRNYRKAFEYQKELKKLTDSLFDERTAEHAATMQARYETNRHRQEIDKQKEIHSLEVQNRVTQNYFTMGAFVLALLAAGVFYSRFRLKQRSNEQLQQQYAEINQQKEEIEAQRGYIEEQNNTLIKQHQDIISSINYAKRIQTAILPPMEEIKKVLPNSFVLFLPKDVVSGDFFWFAEEKDEKTGHLYHIIAAVDCTGHGVPGAFMSLIGNTLLDEIVHILNILSPDLILLELDKRIRKLLKQNETLQRDGMDLAICAINKSQKTLEFAGAMNPLLCVIDNKTELVKGSRNPIGGVLSETASKVFEKHQIDLSQTKENATFYLFSDGFQDQFGGTENKKFMLKNFRQLLADIHTKPFEEQKQILQASLQKWQEAGNETQIDDVLVIGFRLI
jgi:serine phosphatase RsbU (regulator of sigma subunit)